MKKKIAAVRAFFTDIEQTNRATRLITSSQMPRGKAACFASDLRRPSLAAFFAREIRLHSTQRRQKCSDCRSRHTLPSTI